MLPRCSGNSAMLVRGVVPRYSGRIATLVRYLREMRQGGRFTGATGGGLDW